MYAIIEDSGTQVKVAPGDVVELDLRDLSEGQDEVTFDRVLAVGGDGPARLGTPYIDGATVTAKVLGSGIVPLTCTLSTAHHHSKLPA